MECVHFSALARELQYTCNVMITNTRLVECPDECVLGMNRQRSLNELNGPECFQPWKGWKGGHKPSSHSVRTRMNTPQICRKTQDGNMKKMYCRGLKEGPWICIPEVELQAVRRAPGSYKRALSAMSNTHIIVPSQRVSVCICSLHAILPTATTKTTQNGQHNGFPLSMHFLAEISGRCSAFL